MPLGNSIAKKFKYNGQELEEALGLNLYEMDFRQYDPAIGRFTSIDPVTHFGYSPYQAFDNNPVFWADPSGAESVQDLINRVWNDTPNDGLVYHYDGSGNQTGTTDPNEENTNDNGETQTGCCNKLTTGERIRNILSGKEYLNDFDDYITDPYLSKAYTFTYSIIDEQNKIFILYGIDNETGELISFSTPNEGFTWEKFGQGFLDQFNPWPYGGETEGITLLGAPRLPRGWIKRSLFGKLSKSNPQILEHFKSALKKGHVGPTGQTGIKLLKGNGIDGFRYELKILGKGTSHYRLLGNVETWKNGSIIVFRKLINN